MVAAFRQYNILLPIPAIKKPHTTFDGSQLEAYRDGKEEAPEAYIKIRRGSRRRCQQR